MCRKILITSLLAAAVAAVSGCAQKSSGDQPAEKSARMVAGLAKSKDAQSGKPRLEQARVSTKSGPIQILEPDGSLTEMTLGGDSPNPFAITEASLMLLNSNLDLDLSGMPDLGPVRKRGLTAQQQALADFAARSRPLLPVLPADFEVEADMFRGVSVEVMKRSSEQGQTSPTKRAAANNGLVTVHANLRRGLDANTAFAYATCALAGWAEGQGTQYARHIWTQQTKRNGELQLGAVFTLSDNRPMGLKVMNTGQTAQECKVRGIPAT